MDDTSQGVDKIRLTGYNGGFAFKRYNRSGRYFTWNEIIFDINEGGKLTETGRVRHSNHSGQWFYRAGEFSSWQEPYGASYIRWANMAWRR